MVFDKEKNYLDGSGIEDFQPTKTNMKKIIKAYFLKTDSQCWIFCFQMTQKFVITYI